MTKKPRLFIGESIEKLETKVIIPSLEMSLKILLFLFVREFSAAGETRQSVTASKSKLVGRPSQNSA